jgi:uncharacterized protein
MRMKKNRREFLKLTGMAGIGFTSAGILGTYGSDRNSKSQPNKVIVDHAVATLEDGNIVNIPFWRVESGRDGPSLLLIAAQHGNEVHGTEVARRFQEVCGRELMTGSAWIIPMANLPAVRVRRHSINLGPGDPISVARFEGHNMNLVWPGNSAGNDTERVAYALDQAVVRHCSHGVDIHCWNQFYAAETLSVKDHEPSYLLGEATTTRFISYRSSSSPPAEKMLISQLFRARERPVAVIELSGQFQMKERQVQMGLCSMVNIAKLLGMIKGEPELIVGQRAVRSPENSHEVQAPCSGIFMPATGKENYATLDTDDFVEEGQFLGHIIRESDLTTLPVTAPVSGYLWQYGMCHTLENNIQCDASLPAQHPYAEEGNRIAVLVTV